MQPKERDTGSNLVSAGQNYNIQVGMLKLGKQCCIIVAIREAGISGKIFYTKA